MSIEWKHTETTENECKRSGDRRWRAHGRRRGALDARASRINDAMKIAAVEAIRALVKEPVPAEVLVAAGVSELAFGKEYVIPKPMDARLLPRVARAVALAAVASGVARIELPGDYMLG